MEESFPMTGGDGTYSYAKNSSKQKEAAEKAKSMLVSAIIENLEIDQASSDPFCVADLGCSTGPNTFMAMDNIIEAITQNYKNEGHSSLPEFQVYFNDHASNDFNILFANLPTNRKYFAAGVPGSFHGRLFPKANLNFVYSAFALHWLSKAPQELSDLNSPAYNKGRIYYSNAPNEVGQAYSSQYAKDMESFLDARANEFAPGGLMALFIPGRPDGTLPSDVSLGPLFHPLESTLLDMVDEGLISQDKVDSFNLPIYSPSAEEVRTLVYKNGHFAIARMQLLPQSPTIPLFSANECRSGFQSILSKHFGSDMIEPLFERYSKKIAVDPFLSAADSVASGLFILLKCKE